MLTNDSTKICLKIYEALLCLYIIIAPINNALNEQGIYAMVGYAAMLLVSLGLVCGSLGGAFNADKKLGGFYTGAYLVIAFTALGTLTKLISYHGATQLLMYAQFVSLSRRVDLKKVFCAFYVSSIICAIWSISLGWVSSEVSRTATSIDGSIAPAVIAITLFAKETFAFGKNYRALKIAALCAAIVVAFFGMSRSRLLLIAVMLALKLIVSMRQSVMSGRVSQTVILAIPVLIVVVAIVAKLDVTKKLLDAIGERYESGFEDYIRDMERQAGWDMFRQNWLFGRGWNKLLFKLPVGYRVYDNHNMYVTILARGGIILAGTMFYSFYRVLKRVIEKKNALAMILFGLLLALGYGNAGVFNYTICSLMAPMAILLDSVSNEPDQEENNNEDDLRCQG